MTKNEAVALLEREQDHTRFLEELLAARHGDGWEKLTIFDAKKLRDISKIEQQRNCAAGPWCYDMKAAPMDGSGIGILLLDTEGGIWLGYEPEQWPCEPIAFAGLRLPKEKP